MDDMVFFEDVDSSKMLAKWQQFLAFQLERGDLDYLYKNWKFLYNELERLDFKEFWSKYYSVRSVLAPAILAARK